mgnify:CR=1 FL=1
MPNIEEQNLTEFLLEVKAKMANITTSENNEIIERPADQTTITKRYTDKAVDFIRKNKDENFFISSIYI